MIGAISCSKMFICASIVIAAGIFALSSVHADTFGTGVNQFDIQFVTIAGDASTANGANISQYTEADTKHKTFTDPDQSYRIGVYEITNDQWNKFIAINGAPTGQPTTAYDTTAFYTGSNMPTNNVSWYEAAHFVNWLNTSSGHQAAYNYDASGNFLQWDSSVAAGDGTNLYRHADAMYYLPTENEWVKAAYWNGNDLQTYATRPGDTLHQGDGVSGTGWNYYDGGGATDPTAPWSVGSGSQELNGTYDMMGNVWELTESPFYVSDDYGPDSRRSTRGSSCFDNNTDGIMSSARYYNFPYAEYSGIGFRVASQIPEPTTLTLLGLSGAIVIKRRRRM